MIRGSKEIKVAKQRNKTTKNRKAERERYEIVKEKVKKLEEKNFSRLVLFRSGEEWLKMGGNSLLIYYYIIAPKLKVKPNLQPDTDYTREIFEDGILSFRGVEAIRKKLEKLDVIKAEREGLDSVVFELNFSVSAKEIERLKDELEYEQEKRLTILKPAVVLVPIVYEKLRHIQRRVFETVRKMSIYERDYNGLLMAEYSRKMVKYYMMINNGLLAPKEGYRKIQEVNNLLMIEISFATELKIWRQDVAVSIGAELIEVKREVDLELRRLEEERKK